MKPPSPDLTPLLDTVFKPTTPYLDKLTRIAKRWNEIDKKEEGNGTTENRIPRDGDCEGR